MGDNYGYLTKEGLDKHIAMLWNSLLMYNKTLEETREKVGNSSEVVCSILAARGDVERQLLEAIEHTKKSVENEPSVKKVEKKVEKKEKTPTTWKPTKKNSQKEETCYNPDLDKENKTTINRAVEMNYGATNKNSNK